MALRYSVHGPRPRVPGAEKASTGVKEQYGLIDGGFRDIVEHGGAEDCIGPKIVKLADLLRFGPYWQDLSPTDQESLQGDIKTMIQHAAESGMVMGFRRRQALHEIRVSAECRSHEVLMIPGR